MTADKTIFIEHKAPRAGKGPQVDQAKAGGNVVAHYGIIAEQGEDKWIAIEKLVRRLRKLGETGAAGKDAAVPDRFKNFEKFIIPAQVLQQDKAAPIDREKLRLANGEKAGGEKAAGDKAGGKKAAGKKA